MRTWRNIFVLAGLLLVMLAAWVWMVVRRPPAIPTLAFIGYTNKPLTFVAARVLLRNESRVPLEVLPQVQNANVIETNGEFFHAPGFHSPFSTTLPEIVRPGETAVLDIHLNYDFGSRGGRRCARDRGRDRRKCVTGREGSRNPHCENGRSNYFPRLKTVTRSLGHSRGDIEFRNPNDESFRTGFPWFLEIVPWTFFQCLHALPSGARTQPGGRFFQLYFATAVLSALALREL